MCQGNFLQRSQLMTQKILKHGYLTPTLKLSLKIFYGFHHEVVYHYEISKDYNGSFARYIYYCCPLSPTRFSPDLTMSNTTVVLQETGTAKSSRGHGLNSGFMVGLQLLIILALYCFIFISPLFYSKIILFFYHICFTRQTSAWLLCLWRKRAGKVRAMFIIKFSG